MFVTSHISASQLVELINGDSENIHSGIAALKGYGPVRIRYVVIIITGIHSNSVSRRKRLADIPQPVKSRIKINADISALSNVCVYLTCNISGNIYLICYSAVEITNVKVTADSHLSVAVADIYV